MRQLALEYLGKREYSYVELGQKLKSQIVKADFREKRSEQKKEGWRKKNLDRPNSKADRDFVSNNAFKGNDAFQDFAEIQLQQHLHDDTAEESDSKQPIDLEAVNAEITAILDDFKAKGWLSDARFTDQMVHARQAKFGVSKIAHELRQKGVSADLVTDAIEKVKVNELDNAREIWQKKYKNEPTNREEWAKQAKFLQSRGFGFDTIKQVLNIKHHDD